MSDIPSPSIQQSEVYTETGKLTKVVVKVLVKVENEGGDVNNYCY